MKEKEIGFAPQQFTHEVVVAPFRLRTYRFIRRILVGFICISIVNGLFSYFFYTPKMYRINRENSELVLKYHLLQDKIRTLQRRTEEIRHRDNHVYRALFATDTLAIEGIRTPYPDSKYASLESDVHASLMAGDRKSVV